MRRFLRENGLSVALFGFFLVFLAGQSIAGLKVHNDDAAAHGGRPSGYLSYLASGHFIEAVFENWESEFLQMAAFVVLTIFLRQKGSSESKPLDEEPEPKRPKPKPGSPWPVRRGGWIETVYQNSLTIALVLLFLLSFGLHALGGAAEANQERSEHGKPAFGRLAYLGTRGSGSSLSRTGRASSWPSAPSSSSPSFCGRRVPRSRSRSKSLTPRRASRQDGCLAVARGRGTRRSKRNAPRWGRVTLARGESSRLRYGRRGRIGHPAHWLRRDGRRGVLRCRRLGCRGGGLPLLTPERERGGPRDQKTNQGERPLHALFLLKGPVAGPGAP